jgi:hypothetical protein
MAAVAGIAFAGPGSQLCQGTSRNTLLLAGACDCDDGSGEVVVAHGPGEGKVTVGEHSSVARGDGVALAICVADDGRRASQVAQPIVDEPDWLAALDGVSLGRPRLPCRGSSSRLGAPNHSVDDDRVGEVASPNASTLPSWYTSQ